MCGICGVYDPRGGIDVELVRRMNVALRHRGPDANAVKPFGQCVLAYNRLSIIDLATGDQPMSDEAGTSWIVYNGEIYNYKALRQGLLDRGHTLATNSDTEAIVHLYEERGPDAVLELNGMFGFAIWDDARRRLLVARDRLGVKPMYYFERDGRVAFASEIKGILADPSVPRRLNYAALSEYLTFQNVFGDKTFFEGIKVLPPAHLLVVQDGRVEVREYWDLHFREEIVDESEAVRAFGKLLDESVEMQLMSDVPLGSHLSGGVDSGTVVMKAADKLAEPLKTFSVYFEEPAYDESGYIEQVSMLAQSIHYDRLLDPKEFPAVLPKIVYALDEPRVGPSVIPQWYIAEIASKEVKVVLTGHGGDELFAGYPSYIVPYLRDVLRRRDWKELGAAVRNLPEKLRTEGWRRVLGLPLYALVERDLRRYGREAVIKDREQRRLLSPEARRAIGGHDPRAELERVLAKSDAVSALDRILYLDIKTYLPSLLIVEDRMSMAHSLEDRVPILDHRIAELSARIPGRMKIRALVLKWIPRRSAEGVLPKSVLEHRKVGFLVPLAEWLRGPLRPFVEETLLGERALRRGLFRPEAVRALVREHMEGSRDLSWKLWSLLNVELWHRTWIDTSPAAPPA
ncbi:MAG: asparagine synthase (glutamine-hydrolyzing) [Euryarchaeota archaeon RBG_16_68_12]|nr:MAG: asparagine synthase (glutamine-hydrolyzing) [Euryarchaeota archaeon RBG_16_68_12]